MKNTTLIQVTGDDIKNGVPRKCGFDPIALALKRSFNLTENTVDIQHEHGEMYLPSINKHKVFTLPESMMNFIASFDNGDKNLQPFSAEIELSA